MFLLCKYTIFEYFSVENSPEEFIKFNVAEGKIEKIKEGGYRKDLKSEIHETEEEQDISYEIDDLVDEQTDDQTDEQTDGQTDAQSDAVVTTKKDKKRQVKKSCKEKQKVVSDLGNLSKGDGVKKSVKRVPWNETQELGMTICI